MLEECSPYRPEGFSEKWEDGEEEELDYAKQVDLSVNPCLDDKEQAAGSPLLCV